MAADRPSARPPAGVIEKIPPVTAAMPTQQGESVADILARAAKMAATSPVYRALADLPRKSAAPTTSPSYVASSPRAGESVADILARAAQLGGGSPSRVSTPSPASALSVSAPKATSSGESVASILARAAAMSGGSSPASPAASASYSAPRAAAPAPVTSSYAPKSVGSPSGESVAEILARAAAMSR